MTSLEELQSSAAFAAENVDLLVKVHLIKRNTGSNCDVVNNHIVLSPIVNYIVKV